MQMAVKGNPRPLAELTAIQRDVLAQLGQMDNPTGTAVAEALEDSYGDSVVYGTVANCLKGLEQMGLAESERDGREKHYETTDAGDRELEADINWRQT